MDVEPQVDIAPPAPDYKDYTNRIKQATDSLDRSRVYEEDLSTLTESLSSVPKEVRIKMVQEFISGEFSDKSTGLDKYALGQTLRVLVVTDEEDVAKMFTDKLKDVDGLNYDTLFNMGIIANSGLNMQMVYENLTEAEIGQIQAEIDVHKRVDDDSVESAVRLLYGFEGSLYNLTDQALQSVVDTEQDVKRLKSFVEREVHNRMNSDKGEAVEPVCEAMFYLIRSKEMRTDNKYYEFFKQFQYDVGGEVRAKALLYPILDSKEDGEWRKLLSQFNVDEYGLVNLMLTGKLEPSEGSSAEKIFQETVSGFNHYSTAIRMATILVSNYGGQLSGVPENITKPLLDRIKYLASSAEFSEDRAVSWEMSSLLLQISVAGGGVHPELLDCLQRYSKELDGESSHAINLENDYYIIHPTGTPTNCTDQFVKLYARGQQSIVPPEITEIFGDRLLDEKKLAKTLLNRHLYDLGEGISSGESDETAIDRINELNHQFKQDYGKYLDQQFADFDIKDLKEVFKGNTKGNRVCVVGLRHQVNHQRTIYVDFDRLFPEKSRSSIKGLISKSSSIDEWLDCEHFLITFSDSDSLSNFSEAERYLINSAKADTENLPNYLKYKEIICSSDKEGARQKIELLRRILNTKAPGVVAVQEELIGAVLGSPNGSAELERITEILSDKSTPELVSTLQIFKLLYPLSTLASEYDVRRGTGSSVIARYANAYRDLNQEEGDSQPDRIQEVFDALIYADLLKIAVRTADPSLEDFSLAIVDLKSKLERDEEVGVDQIALLSKLHNILDGGNVNLDSFSYSDATHELLIRTQKNSLGDLVASYEQKLLNHLGLDKVEDVARLVELGKNRADGRNRELVRSGRLSLGEGSLIKGVHSYYLESYSSHGFRCPELLGENASYDGTPNDVDMSLVLPEDSTGSLRDVVESSLAKGYGDFMIVVSNEDVLESVDGKVDPGKYELVRQNVARHVGIRSGFGWYDVEAVIIKNEDNLTKLIYYITEKGAYIPIVNLDGEVLFSEEEFDQLNTQRASLSEVNVRGLLAIKEPMSSNQIIDVLRESSYLDSLYSSHITPDSTLADHSLNVAKMYEDIDLGGSQTLLESNAMKLALLLHDIGKTQAVEVENDSSKQHTYTEKIVRRFFKDSGVDLKTASLITSLVSQDFLGHYFQEMDDLEQTVYLLKSEAKKLGVGVVDYLDLLKVYFVCDAGSYTSRYGDTNLLDSVFDTSTDGKISLSEDYIKKFDLLKGSL